MPKRPAMRNATFTTAAFAVLFICATPPCIAGSSPMDTIRQAAADFNGGNYAAWAAACASSAMVTDDFAPYTWNGPGACRNWYAAWRGLTKAHGINNVTVLFGAPMHAAVGRDAAYIVLPASLHFNQNGRPVRMTSNVMTIVLHKNADGDWKMTAWTWADGK